MNESLKIEINYGGEFEQYHASLFRISSGNLDIALIKTNNPLSSKAKKIIRETEEFLEHSVDVRYLQGGKVYAVGYTFSTLQTIDFKAVATQGNISKIIVYKNGPFLIGTTCPIYNGFSGGAIISSKGNFLGLITYNFQHKTKGFLNDFNFSYSSHIFKEMFDLIDVHSDQKIKDLDLWNTKDGYIEKMAHAQTIEYVPAFEVPPSPKL